MEKTLILSIICSECKNEEEKIFNKELIEILKIIGLIENIYNYFKNVAEENINEELRLKIIDGTRNYFLEEVKQNKLISRKHEKICTTLNYIEHFLILASTITGCISISAFGSLIGIPIRTMNSAIGYPQ